MTLAWAAVLVVPALIAGLSIEALRRSRWSVRVADHPNERSLHTVPTPRVGGLGVMAGALPVAALFADASLLVLLACAAVLALVSLADDIRSLPIEVRLPAHIAAATVAYLAITSPPGGHGGSGIVEAAVAIVAVVWMTNLFNFMDGSDGLAGGMAAIGFGALAMGAAAAGTAALALTAAAIASASLGFLLRNFPPARVFLGDAGSVPLGFLAGALGLHGALAGAWPLWFPFLVFSPFIADATVTILRRAARGERFWRAHRSHYYQRLVLAGWTRRSLALRAYALMAAAAATALAARGEGPEVQFGIILGSAAFYALLLVAIERRLRSVD
jgi:UDP-N-acetylmuramyl pentapeptide phosphotransferase/UDP-N-acetylglucosamine-1-phosphate transferase